MTYIKICFLFFQQLDHIGWVNRFHITLIGYMKRKFSLSWHFHQKGVLCISLPLRMQRMQWRAWGNDSASTKIYSHHYSNTQPSTYDSNVLTSQLRQSAEQLKYLKDKKEYVGLFLSYIHQTVTSLFLRWKSLVLSKSLNIFYLSRNFITGERTPTYFLYQECQIKCIALRVRWMLQLCYLFPSNPR